MAYSRISLLLHKNPIYWNTYQHLTWNTLQRTAHLIKHTGHLWGQRQNLGAITRWSRGVTSWMCRCLTAQCWMDKLLCAHGLTNNSRSTRLLTNHLQLTGSAIHRTQELMTVFTKACYCRLSWVNWTQYTLSTSWYNLIFLLICTTATHIVFSLQIFRQKICCAFYRILWLLYIRPF
jgi:hypothetical protein